MKQDFTKVKVDKKIYVHNDLGNAAHYFGVRVEERVRKGDREGIGHEMMACLVLLAFTVEAQFNFLGFKLIQEWDEWQPTLKKVHAVLKRLDAENDLTKRPYKTIVDLEKFRDSLAHGKPLQITEEEHTVRATEEELQKKGALSADYEAFLTDEFVALASADVDAIWKDLLERAKLGAIDTLTIGGIEYTMTVKA